MNEFKDLGEIAAFIRAFEEKHQEMLLEYTFSNWLAWHIIRKPLYFIVKKKTLESTTNQKVLIPKKPFSIRKALSEAWFLLKNRKTYKNKVIVLSHSRYIKNGLFSFLEPLFHGNKIVKILLSESLDNKDSSVKNLSYFIIKAFKVLFFFHPRIKEIVQKHHSQIIQHKYKELQFSNVSEYELKAILVQFHAQKWFFKLFFRILNPNAICTVDQVGAGLMAAGKESGLKIYEFQHGYFHKYKPDYNIPKYFDGWKVDMICPSKIIVFGNAFKDTLLSEGFWKEKEIYVLGNYKINELRKRRFSESNLRTQVLLITQPSCFQGWKRILSILADSSFSKMKFLVKIHPNETVYSKRWYESFVKENPDFSLHDSDTNIYDLILQTNLSMGFHSTALLETLALEKPIVIFDLDKSGQHPFSDFYDNVKHNHEINIMTDLTDLPKVLKNFSDSNTSTLKEHSIGKYFYEADYEARAESLIHEMTH